LEQKSLNIAFGSLGFPFWELSSFPLYPIPTIYSYLSSSDKYSHQDFWVGVQGY
jgi:hypothetical protein